MLFSFTGERIVEKTTAREVSQGGTISISGTSGDPSLAFAEQPEVQVSVSGQAKTPRSRDYIGTGSLFTFSEEQNLQLQNHQQILHCSLFKENLRTSLLQTMLVLVHSENYLVLRKQLPSIQTRSKFSSRLLVREIQKRELPEKSAKVELLLYLELLLSVLLWHIKEKVQHQFLETQVLQEPEILLVLDLFQHSVVLQNLLPSIQKRSKMLFSFVGTRDSEKITARELGTPGEFTLQGTSGDPLLTFAEKSFGNVTVSGVSTVIRTQAFAGSGRLFGFANGDEAYARAPYVTSGTINVSGNALVQVEVFQPPRAYVWII